MAVAVSRPLNSTPTPRPTVPTALKANPAPMNSPLHALGTHQHVVGALATSTAPATPPSIVSTEWTADALFAVSILRAVGVSVVHHTVRVLRQGVVSSETNSTAAVKQPAALLGMQRSTA